MKKFVSLLFFSIIISLAGAPSISVAQTEISPQPLEVDYPAIEFPSGGKVKPEEGTSFEDYVAYIFYAMIGLSGLAAFGVIVYAGFQYFTSVGDPTKIKDAKDKIKRALLGLAILFFSVLGLNLINPRLKFINLGELPVAGLPDIESGVYLCKERAPIKEFWDLRLAAENHSPEQMKKDFENLKQWKAEIQERCVSMTEEGTIASSMAGQVSNVYLVPSYGQAQYGVILYEESGFGGEATVLYGATHSGIKDLENPTEWLLSNFNVASAKPFILNFSPPQGWYVELYERVYQNRDDPTAASKLYDISDIDGAAYFNVLKPEIGSLKIEGNAIVIMFKEGGGWTVEGTELDIFTNTDNDLNNDKMGRWNPNCIEVREPHWDNRPYPCASHMVVVAIR